MVFPIRAIVLMVVLASCADAQSPFLEHINSAQFSSKASFAREGYVVRFPITNSKGETAVEISCYSLDDEERETFALKNGTDPVADLSCYVKDMSRENEYTMLGLDGESLQFTPAFFWLTEIGKCLPRSYRLEASIRKIHLTFDFSNINLDERSADLDVSVNPMPSATNSALTNQYYQEKCT